MTQSEQEHQLEVRYEVREHVARVTIDREPKRNALSFDTTDQLLDSFRQANRDRDVRVIVLTGTGDTAFCAGADLSGIRGGGNDAEEAHAGRGHLASLFTEMYHLGKPTIARVQGYALAGGFGLALACDFVVASENATFGAPEVNIGLWPYMITVPLVRSMRPKDTLDLILTGRRVTASEGRDLGFVSRLTSAANLDPRSMSLQPIWRRARREPFDWGGLPSIAYSIRRLPKRFRNCRRSCRSRRRFRTQPRGSPRSTKSAPPSGRPDPTAACGVGRDVVNRRPWTTTSPFLRMITYTRCWPGTGSTVAKYGVAVVGAGIVGLAVAREILQHRPSASSRSPTDDTRCPDRSSALRRRTGRRRSGPRALDGWPGTPPCSR